MVLLFEDVLTHLLTQQCQQDKTITFRHIRSLMEETMRIVINLKCTAIVFVWHSFPFYVQYFQFFETNILSLSYTKKLCKYKTHSQNVIRLNQHHDLLVKPVIIVSQTFKYLFCEG